MSTTDTVANDPQHFESKWDEFALSDNMKEMDKMFMSEFGIPQFEANKGADPVQYAESLRKYLVEDHPLTGIKVRDRYILRRLSVGFAKVSENFHSANFTDISEFGKGMTDAFGVLVDRYASKYSAELDNPKLFISIFEPIMRVLQDEEVAKVVNTYANTEQKEAIMSEYSKRKEKQT